MRLKKWMYIAAASYGLLVMAWLLQPMIHTFMHLCPVRPDGVQEAQAVPAFARKYGISCMQCHSAFPVLNAYGRQFKMNGYVRERGSDDGVLQSQDKELWMDKVFPWGIRVKSRPFDNGRETVANADAGGGFKMQPLNAINLFVASGDAARHVSFFGEIEAGTEDGFDKPSVGDLKFGYHPFTYLNVILARKGFFNDDPYQTITGDQSPTIAGRATDLGLANQGSISGTALKADQQTMYTFGRASLPDSAAFLYYAAGATKDDSNTGKQSNSPTNGNLRLAFDTGKGLMVGTFGTYGHQGPRDASAFTGGPAGVLAKQQFMRGGFDVLWEIGDLAARGAFAYLHDGDPSSRGAVATDRAAYAELAYSYQRGDAQYPFLMPLIRENWYTTFNGTQQFNYVTSQVAHYFAPNIKAFAEYSFDTKQGYQNGTLANPSVGGNLALRGNRGSLQVEVGF